MPIATSRRHDARTCTPRRRRRRRRPSAAPALPLSLHRRAARAPPRRARGRGRRARARCWCGSATAASAARTCTTSTTAASAPCASSEPMMLGHEVAGTVQAVARRRDPVRPGDRWRSTRAGPAAAAATAWKACPTNASTCASTAARCATPHVEGAFRDLLVCDAVQCEPVAPRRAAAARGAGRAVLGGAARASRAPGRCSASGCWSRAAARSAPGGGRGAHARRGRDRGHRRRRCDRSPWSARWARA